VYVIDTTGKCLEEISVRDRYYRKMFGGNKCTTVCDTFYR